MFQQKRIDEKTPYLFGVISIAITFALRLYSRFRFVLALMVVVTLMVPCRTHATRLLYLHCWNHFWHNGSLWCSEKDLLWPSLEKEPEKRAWLTDVPLFLGDGYSYKATYEVVNGELTLKKLRRHIVIEEDILEKFLSVAQPKDSVFKIDYTGTVVLHCFIMVSEFEPIFENHILLEFKNGILVKETHMDSVEYLTIYLKYNHFDLNNDDDREYYEKTLQRLKDYRNKERGK